VEEKNTVQYARSILERLRETKLELQEGIQALAFHTRMIPRSKGPSDLRVTNNAIDCMNEDISKFQTTLQVLEPEWNRIRQDTTLWNQTCMNLVKEKFTYPNVLDDLQILWPSTLLPDDAHENVSFLMGLNFASKVLQHGVESYSKEQVLQLIPASLPQIDHQVSDSEGFSYGYTKDKKISINSSLYTSAKGAINSGYIVAYAFIIGVTILHELAHFKMRVHDETGKKFMKAAGRFIETNLFGGTWEHRPTPSTRTGTNIDFSNISEIVLVVNEGSHT
jgi:hypothetical protein